MQTTQSDQQLVNGILQGSEFSLRIFYKTFEKPLQGFIRKKVANESDGQELFQDVMMAVIERLRDFSFRSSLFTYICAIAYHKIIDYYRRKKIRQVLFSTVPEFEDMCAQLRGPEEIFDTVMLKQKISKTFEKLTPGYRQILSLKYIDGYSVIEIAMHMSITFKSAESLLFRARKAFVLAYTT